MGRARASALSLGPRGRPGLPQKTPEGERHTQAHVQAAMQDELERGHFASKTPGGSRKPRREAPLDTNHDNETGTRGRTRGNTTQSQGTLPSRERRAKQGRAPGHRRLSGADTPTDRTGASQSRVSFLSLRACYQQRHSRTVEPTQPTFLGAPGNALEQSPQGATARSERRPAFCAGGTRPKQGGC